MRLLAVPALVVGLSAMLVPSASAAVPMPGNDSFYRYTGSTPLSSIKPGTVLKTRSFDFAPSGVTTPYRGTQLLYRTTTQLGEPTVTVTSVILPAGPAPTRLVSDQFFYDALDGKCDPSYYLANNGSSGGGTNMVEGPIVASLLAAGNAVVTSDYEGTDLAWTAGPQSGKQTLDGIRAALSSTAVGLPAATKVGLMGYSGGAIASEWAAELAATYAPDVSKRIVGTAIGGVYVYPAHNLRYVDGTDKWSGVIPGALVGVARGFHIDLNDYASTLGKRLAKEAASACIDELLGKHPGLTFAQLAKPQYSDFAKVPAFVKINNALIMSTGGTPRAPMYIGQGIDTTNQEGTPQDTPGIGPGDGVMVAGDVRTLARTYCRRGVSVDYAQFDGFGHTAAIAPFLAGAVPFLTSRFLGVPAVGDCATIAPGNSLAPLPTPAAQTTTQTTTHHGTTRGGTHRPSSGAGGRARVTGLDTDPVAATGLDTTGLLLWSAALLCLGAALMRLGVRGPQPAAPVRPRRPLPYPRP